MANEERGTPRYYQSSERVSPPVPVVNIYRRLVSLCLKHLLIVSITNIFRTLASHTADEIHETRSTLSNQVNNLLDSVSNIAGSLSYCGADLSYIKDRAIYQERANVLDWISDSTDLSESYNQAIRHQEPGTGRWLLDSDGF
jgi:hypothetical protein